MSAKSTPIGAGDDLIDHSERGQNVTGRTFVRDLCLPVRGYFAWTGKPSS